MLCGWKILIEVQPITLVLLSSFGIASFFSLKGTIWFCREGWINPEDFFSHQTDTRTFCLSSKARIPTKPHRCDIIYSSRKHRRRFDKVYNVFICPFNSKSTILIACNCQNMTWSSTQTNIFLQILFCYKKSV